MKSVAARRLFALLSVGVLVVLAFQVFTAGAAPGDGLATISTAPPCTGGIAGIGVAFDGNNILYTCADEAKVHKTDLTGANLGAVDTKNGSGDPVSVDAIAWDSNDAALWGGDLDGQGNCRIWKINMGTGIASLEFTFTDPSGLCGGDTEFYDGITVDPSTNSLYLSPDVNPTIRHFDKAGNPLAGDPIPFSTLTDDLCTGFPLFSGCPNSGLAIGIDGVLFAGTNGFGKIVELDPTVPSFLGQFASVSGRDEDLECGPLFTKLDGSVVETILSREAFSGRIDVLEAPPGTCVVFQLGLTPATAINFTGTSHTVTATLTANGSPLAGRTILFSTSGANSASGSGTSDASGQASFSYVGSNPGNDTITACADINNNGSCDPQEPTATAQKEWEAQITVTGTTFNAVEGNSVSAVVATVVDPDPASTASEYSATIAWGDGSSSAGTLSGPTGGPFDVNGTHTYVEEGTYTVTVVVTDVDFPANNGTAASTAVVADAALSASCATPAVSLQAFSGSVATFTDANPLAPLSDFTATIVWGDGSSSAGVVSGPVGGPFTVSGSHNYASTGTFTIGVSIVDEGGSTASTECDVLIFAFAPGGGAFVVGDQNSANGTSVTFWGAQWSKLNSLSGGAAPSSFKGFAQNPSVPSCGTGWSTDPGNSAPPPAGPLPAFMGVIVSSSSAKKGSQISGDTVHIVVVQTNAGYDTNPGHSGTGTVVAQVC
jgi:hypothetical protein